MKHRTKAPTQTTVKESEFIRQADQVELDPNGARDYKSVLVTMNQFEYERMERLMKKYGQTQKGIYRYALQMLEELN